MLRVGLVGAGVAASRHARALSQLHAKGILAWVACCARDAERVRSFCALNGAPAGVEALDDFDALVGSRSVDALVIATPDAVHAEQATIAAYAGLAVLVEAPLASTIAQGMTAVNAAAMNGTCLSVGYHLRFVDAHVAMVTRMQELVGDVRAVYVRWSAPDINVSGWRARGETGSWCLAAVGTHCIDLAVALSGGVPPSDVTALRDPPRGTDISVEVTFRSGTTMAHVSASVDVLQRSSSRVVVYGSGGEVEALETMAARGASTVAFHVPGRPAVSVPHHVLDPYEAQLRSFVDNARRGYVDDPTTIGNLAALAAALGVPPACSLVRVS